MRSRAATLSFLAISLAAVLAMPIVNLSGNPSTRNIAIKLLKARDGKRLAQLLFRADTIVSQVSTLTWRLGWSTAPTKVIVGWNDWLFLGDQYAQNTSRFRFGETGEDARHTAQVSHNLLAWDRWLRNNGVQGFAIVVGPDKHTIYASQLPRWADLERPRPIRGLLDGPAAHLFADPTDALRQAVSEGGIPTYYRSDTHWNLYGAAISLGALRQTLERQSIELHWPDIVPPAPAEVETRIGGDLGNFLRIGDRLQDPEPVPVIRDRASIASEAHERLSGHPVTPDTLGQLPLPRGAVVIQTPSALNRHKVLWLRDSFGAAQSPWMTTTFQEIIQFRWGIAFSDGAEQLVKLVREERPELVLMTSVERSLFADILLTPPPQD